MLVLMDIKMPGMNGIDATRAILHTSPHIGVLIVTMFDDDDLVFAALRAGAPRLPVEGCPAWMTCALSNRREPGEAIFSPAIARRVMQFFSAPQLPAQQQLFPELDGSRTRGADADWAGPQQRGHRRSPGAQPEDGTESRQQYSQKLQVNDRAQALIRARDAGLV